MQRHLIQSMQLVHVRYSTAGHNTYVEASVMHMTIIHMYVLYICKGHVIETFVFLYEVTFLFLDIADQKKMCLVTTILR